jgi:hypothetical protein
MSSRRAIHTGDRFGRLVILRQEGDETHCRRQAFECKCDCGSVCVVKRSLLIRPNDGSKSCGCVRRENSGLAAQKVCTKHGKTGTREYRIWAHIVDRCTKPGRSDADRYYNRGIWVHVGWVGPGGFERFLAHLGTAPSASHSVDRKDNDRGYEPGNVRWATKKEQARNRRSNRLITVFGRTQPVAAWAEESRVKSATIINRLALGWSPEEALTTPLWAGGRPKVA